MKLELSDITRILTDRPNKDIVWEAQEMYKHLIVHNAGQGLEKALQRKDYFEKEDIHNTKKQLAISCVDLISRVRRPVDKVYSAKGGSVYYMLPESKKRDFINKLSNVEYGYDLRKWLQVFWMPAFHFDPMGLIHIEVDAEGSAYPTYKSIMSVFDYRLNGRDLDYVVYELEATPEELRAYGKLFRVVDDMFDYTVGWNGTEAVQIQDRTYPNYFGKVPAIIISDIFDSITGMYKSADHDIVELLDLYLDKNATLIVHEKLFGYPQKWAYAPKCSSCSGTGDNGKCETCKGKGLIIPSGVSSVLAIPFPDKEDVTIAPNVAGYVTPDIEGLREMKEGLKEIEQKIFSTKWGDENVTKYNGNNVKTATEIYYNEQPKIAKLNVYSDASEYMEKWVIDMLGGFYYQSSYNGSVVNYGRQYMADSQDTIFKKYEDARANGAPETVLNDLLSEYYQNKYQNDANELNKYIKLMYVEPYVHYTLLQIIQAGITGEKVDMKSKFGDWVGTLTNEYIQNATVEQLRTDLMNYANGSQPMQTAKQTQNSNQLN